MNPPRKSLAISLIWLAWTVGAVLLTFRLLRWQVDWFKSAGPRVHGALVIFLPALAATALGYAWIRQKGLWRFEPLALVLIAGLLALHSEPKASLVVVLFFLAGYSLGALVCDRLALGLPSPLDRIIVRCGVGFGCLIPLVFVLGEFRLLYPGVFAAALLAPLALRHRNALDGLSDLRGLNASWRSAKELSHPMLGVAMTFAFIAMLCSMMVAIPPSMTFDALAAHLPSVQHYVAAHDIFAIPEIAYSYYPQGGEALWTVAYGLAGQAGAQLLSILFFVLFLMAVFRLARACGCDRAAAVVGTLWTATTPFLHWTGSVVKNDMMLVFFQALALFAFVRWLEQRKFAWIVTGVFFMAQSFGVKHVALFGAIPLTLFYAYAVWKQPDRWKAVATLASVFLLFGIFWTVRTYVLTGNPVYPAVAGAAVPGVAPHGEPVFFRYVKLPWKITFDGHAAFESPLQSPAGIVLFAFGPLILIGLRSWRNRATVAYLLFALLYFGYWAAILSALRYAIVPIAIVTFLLAQAATRFYADRESAAVHVSMLLLQTYCLLFAALGTMLIEVNLPEAAFLAGRIDKAGYLRAALPTFRSLEFLKTIAAPQDMVFGIDNCSRAYAPNPLRFECVLCDMGGCGSKDLNFSLDLYRPRFVIAPTAFPLDQMIQDVHPGRSLESLYRDEHFNVYRIP